MREKLEAIKNSALSEIESAKKLEDIENIKVETLSDVDNTISFIRLKDLNLNTVPIEAYYIKDTLYKYSHEDNEWIVDENVNNVSIEYKDFTINIGFNISGFLQPIDKRSNIKIKIPIVFIG